MPMNETTLSSFACALVAVQESAVRMAQQTSFPTLRIAVGVRIGPTLTRLAPRFRPQANGIDVLCTPKEERNICKSIH